MRFITQSHVDQAGPPVSQFRGYLVFIPFLTLALSQAAYGQPTEPPAQKDGEGVNPGLTDCYGDPLPQGAVTRLGTVRFRHGQWVRSVAFSPDSTRIATASSDHTIRLWDRASGREVRRLTGHGDDAVNFVAFTPDGKQLISATGWDTEIKDVSVRLWDLETGKEVRRLLQDPSGHPMDALALSPDGKTLAGGVRNQVWLVEVPSGRPLGACRLETGNVKCIRFSPDGQSLAAVFEFVGVCLFDVRTQQLVWENGDQPADYYRPGVAFAPDGRTVAPATSVKQPLRLLDAATGKEVRRFEGEHNAAAPLVFSQDGKRIFSDGWGGRRGIIWDVATGKPAGALDPPLGASIGLTLSADGKVLVEAGERTIRFWDAATGKGIPGLDGAQALISALAVSPDSKSVLTASHFDAETGARVWDLDSGRQRATLAGHRCAGVAFAPDGKTFAAGCFEGTPVLADVASGRNLRTFEGASGWVGSLAFTPNGGRLIGTTWFDDRVRTWDTATDKELPPLGSLPKGGGAKCMALAPDGKLLATGGMDKLIRLWDVAAAKEVRQLVGQEGSIWGLAFSPDSRKIAAVTATGKFNFTANGTDRIVRIWDVATGRVVRTLTGPAAGSWSVAWSPDGRVLVTGGEDGEIRLWEVMTGQERARLAGHEGPVSALAFTADGTRLISGGSDTTALVWDLTALGRPARPPAADELPGLWADLIGDDGSRTFRAIAALAASSDRALSLMKEKVRPVAAPEPGRLARLVADLDDNDFTVRERATRELEGLGELAAPALEAALKKNPSAEFRRRAEPLLDGLTEPSVAQRPGIRAVEVLERIGTREARQVLEKLAEGAPGVRLTQEAKASLERLAKRASSAP
jgi:WD40 repeat protein